MTDWTIHTQFDSDPRRNGKLRLLRHETAEGESHVIASNVKPGIAPLLAAAPELLAVLQEAVNKGYMWDHDPELWSKANAAITKAKGE